MNLGSRALVAGLALLLATTAHAEPQSPAEAAQANMQSAAADFGRGAPADALADLDHALVLYRQIGDHSGEAEALLYIGLVNEGLHTKEGTARALTAYTEVIPLFAGHDRAKQAIAANGLARVLEASGQTAPARDAYLSALTLFDAPDHTRAQVLIGLSGVEQTMGENNAARDHAEQALALLTGPMDGQARANALYRLGAACEGLQDPVGAVDAFLRAADANHGLGATQIETLLRKRGALNLMRAAKNLEVTDDASAAIATYTSAAELWHRLDEADMETTAHLSIGGLRQAGGDWAGAEAAYEAGLASAGNGSMRAVALATLGMVAARNGNNRRALDLAEQTLTLLAAPEKAWQRAGVLLQAGNAAAGLHDNARAVRYYAEAEALGGVNPGTRAAAFAAQGEIATDEGDAGRGAGLARLALALHQQLNLPAAANKDRGDLGLALAAAGDKTAALAAFHEGLDVARAAHDAQQEAASLSNIADLLLAFGDIDQAVETYRAAQDAARRAADRATEAAATAHLGMAYHAQGRAGDAIAQLDAAIALRQQIQDRHGEAIDRNDLALVKSETGDPQAALDIYAQTRALFAALSDTYEEATTLNNIGSIYRHLGAREQARRYFEQAADLHTQRHDDENLAVVLNNLANVELTGEHPADAIRYINRALDIERQRGNRVHQATLLSGLAMARDDQGDHAAALELLGRSIAIAEQTGSVGSQGIGLHNRGTVRERMGDLQGALADLQQALPLLRRTGDMENEATCRSVIARIEAAQGQTRQALADVQAAIALNETQRGGIASEELRATFLTRAGAAYALRTELLMRLGESAAALEATEAGRGRSLLDLLTEAQGHVLQHADPARAAKLAELRRALSAKAAQQAKVAPSQAAGLAHEIDDLLAEQDRIEAAIRAADPDAAGLTAPPPMSLAAIQALLDPDTVLLDYTLGETRSFLFVVSSTELHEYDLPPRATLVAAAKALRTAIDAPEDQAGFRSASANLGRLLLDAAGPAIGGKRLVIVADAALQSRIPFATLTLPASAADHGKLLVEANELIAEPSMAALAALRRAAAGRTLPQHGVAIFADPVVSADDARLAGVMRAPDDRAGSITLAAAGGALPRLPGTRNEADAILALADPGTTRAWFGFAATREAAEDPKLAGYRILHFALHGLTDTRTPALSGLVFSLFSSDGSPQDGYLRLADIFALSLPVDLVVLSACQSGLGRDEGGEGLVGLSRGFLYAGAARLVTSLWDVNDASTGDFMARFYAAMLGPRALPPAAALRAAQREMLATAPLHWAAFTLQGEWR